LFNFPLFAEWNSWGIDMGIEKVRLYTIVCKEKKLQTWKLRSRGQFPCDPPSHYTQQHP
jgi:hypothetical protein